MTRERIEDIREVVLPFVRNTLLKTNYENLGKSDAEEFTRDFNEILELAIKALEQEPVIRHNKVKDELNRVKDELEPTTKNDLGVDINILALLEKTYNDFCSCEGGEGWLKIDGKEYSTDAGYAIEGVDIFMEVFKRRLAELPSVTPQEPQSFEWCTDCKEYDQDNHCCHRWSKVIRDTVEDMKQEPQSEWEHDHEILKAYSDGASEVLDKIYTDIQKLRGCSCSCSDGIIDDVEDILDKYKAESEE